MWEGWGSGACAECPLSASQLPFVMCKQENPGLCLLWVLLSPVAGEERLGEVCSLPQALIPCVFKQLETS